MKRQIASIFTVAVTALFLGITVFELNAEARGGGSRSSGSRGSRTYVKPKAPGLQPGQQRQQQQAAPVPNQMQQQPMGGGSFLQSMAGGLMGGMIGSMLFSGFAGASGGMSGGSGGVGLLEIMLMAGAGYLMYRFVKKKKAGS